MFLSKFPIITQKVLYEDQSEVEPFLASMREMKGGGGGGEGGGRNQTFQALYFSQKRKNKTHLDLPLHTEVNVFGIIHKDCLSLFAYTTIITVQYTRSTFLTSKLPNQIILPFDVLLLRTL